VVLNNSKLAPAALFLAIGFLLEPHSLGCLLDLQHETLAERLDLHVGDVFDKLSPQRSLEIEEFELCFFVVLHDRVLLIVVILLKCSLLLPLHVLLRVDDGDADQEEWPLRRVRTLRQYLTRVERELVLAEGRAL